MNEIKTRAAWPDNLRVFVIFLVVVMHSNVTWSGLGGWYYVPTKSADLNLVELVLFGLYGSFTQAWFMGILFFLSGLMAASSYRTKGALRFLRERIVRLGLPLLFFVCVLNPLTIWSLLDWQGKPLYLVPFADYYLHYLSSGEFLGGTGPLWFVEALIFFAAAQVFVRHLRPAKESAKGKVPSPAFFLSLAAGIGAASFCIRLFMPVGTGFLNLQICYFASYIALYALGVHAGENEWLSLIGWKPGKAWLLWGAGAGFAAWAAIMLFGGPLKGQMIINGGWNIPALAYALWEAFIAVSFSLGLCTLFRTHINGGGKFQKILAANAFGVYMFHPPVLIGISKIFAPLALPNLLKHLTTAALAWTATLLLSWLVIQRIPGLRRVSR